MASLIEELFGILEEETGCYRELLNMADNKTDVIIQGNVPSLQELTKQEQVMAGHILRLEKKRKQNLEDICLVLNKKASELTIVQLIDILNEPERSKLSQINQNLLAVVTELQQKNDTHRKLLQQSIDFIDFTMNAVQSMTAAPIGNPYAARGHYNESTGKNFFDAKK